MATFSAVLLYLSLFLSAPMPLASQSKGTGQALWCVAKNNAEDGALQVAVDWACGQGGANCQPIQQGGSCYQPNDIQSHASYAFNDYFLKNGMTPESCDFSHTAALTSVNPSHGSCVYPSSIVAKNGSFTGWTPSSAEPAFGPAGPDLSDGYRSCRWDQHMVFVYLVLIAIWVFW